MGEITSEEAIDRVREGLGVPPDVPGRAWHVRLLQRPGEAYWLVVLGRVDASVGVACVDPVTGEVWTSAELPGRAGHVTVDAAQAKSLAAPGAPAEAEMVWMPCAASRSPLYPLWEIKTSDAVRYVDQQGRVWPDLRPGRPGG